MDAPRASANFEFGQFRLDRCNGGLFRCTGDGHPVLVGLGSRALDLLIALVERHGDLLSKDEIMATVWPNTTVEESNLAVQISALRRVLDKDRTTGSCIQTVPGRGYRFILPVRRAAEAPPPLPGSPSDDCAETPLAVRPVVWRRSSTLIAASLFALCVAAGAWSLFRPGPIGWLVARASPPRLSLVVLPFKNLSDDRKDDYLADGITDDLTTDLAQISDATVIARESAYTYKAEPSDVRAIGAKLGVRYVVEGSVRRIDTTLRVNVQLTSGETGTHLWSDRFDEQITDPAAGQEQIVRRMHDELGLSLIDIESARSLRERPENPDALDLILRARSLQAQPASVERDRDVLALYERALTMDPSSVSALAWVAYYLTNRRPGGMWGSFDDMRRAELLLARARAIAPRSAVVLNASVYWLRSVGRCQEAVEAAQHAIQIDPKRIRRWTGIYNELGVCEELAGHAEEEIALQEKINQLNPRSPWLFVRYQHMGQAALLLGRDQDAIAFFQKSLTVKPDVDNGTTWVFRGLAAAYARTGQVQEAQHWLAEADRLWPYDTVRSHDPDAFPSVAYAEQTRGIQAALRIAGERDHATEDADFGVPADAVLHSESVGPTPVRAPGVTTIKTTELVSLLAGVRPIIIDPTSYSWSSSIPGAIGLNFAGLGGSFTDTAQDRLRDKMHELTKGDLGTPIVALGWNSERFEGRNLALRLAALGYKRVYWYRGGREAWQANGLPEANLRVEAW